MHFMYQVAIGNATETVRLYQERYPNKDVPDRIAFQRLHTRLLERDSFIPYRHCACRVKSIRPANRMEAIIDEVEDRLERNTRSIVRKQGVSHMIAWGVFRVESLHSYHLQEVQANRKLTFCNVSYLHAGFCNRSYFTHCLQQLSFLRTRQCLHVIAYLKYTTVMCGPQSIHVLLVLQVFP